MAVKFTSVAFFILQVANKETMQEKEKTARIKDMHKKNNELIIL